jgi:hypothetical protein
MTKIIYPVNSLVNGTQSLSKVITSHNAVWTATSVIVRSQLLRILSQSLIHPINGTEVIRGAGTI